MTNIIAFNRIDTLQAVAFGEERTNASKNRRDAWGLRNNDPVVDSRRQTVGSLGEMAVMRYFNQPELCLVNVFKAPDVVVNGHGIQVKSSERAADLIIRSDAKNTEPYILCKVSMPPNDPRMWRKVNEVVHGECWSWVELLGWLYPWQARLMADCADGYWKDPMRRNSPAIFIPREDLYPIDSLKEIVYNDSYGAQSEA